MINLRLQVSITTLPRSQVLRTSTLTTQNMDGLDEERHSPYEISDQHLTSPTSSFQTDTSGAWLALKNTVKQCPPQQLSQPLSPKFHPILSSPVVLRLENTGSISRDHLASERTFLAYVRTSLAITSVSSSRVAHRLTEDISL